MGLGFHSAPLVLQLVSFGLLLVATITAPVTNVLSLAEQDDYRFGVLGYCHQSSGSWSCSKAAANYDPTQLGNADNWVFDSSQRQTLSKILIVLPVACFLALVSFLFSIAAHVPAIHSSGFLIVQLIVTVIAFLLAALSCIVTFLLFYPHVTYGSWILIPAAVWPFISLVFIVLAIAFFSRHNSDDDESDSEDNNVTIGKIDDNYGSAFDNSLPPPISEEKKYDAFKTTTKSVNDDSYFDNKSNTHENVAPTDFTNNFLPPLPNQNVNGSSYSGFNTAGRNDSFATATSQPLDNQPANNNFVNNNNNSNINGFGSSNIYGNGNISNNNAIQGNQQKAPAPYPTGSNEFNFTPVPQPNLQTNSSSTNPVSGPAPPSAGSHPYSVRRYSNQNIGPSAVGGQQRYPSEQTNGTQTRMASSVYPESGVGFNASPARNVPVDQNYYPEEDGYYSNNINAHTNNKADYGDDDGFDTNSDFTSVSQRPANPLYYQNLQQNAYGGAPVGGAPVTGMQQPVTGGYGGPPQGAGAYAYSGPIQLPSSGYPPQQAAPPPPRQEGPSKSDILLNSNPEFSIGGAVGRPKPGFRRPGVRGPPGSGAGGYKRPGQNNMITPASLSRDSPYNLR